MSVEEEVRSSRFNGKLYSLDELTDLGLKIGKPEKCYSTFESESGTYYFKIDGDKYRFSHCLGKVDTSWFILSTDDD